MVSLIAIGSLSASEKLNVFIDKRYMQKKINRLRWQCRRGMLELDLLLLPFFDRHYLGLNEAERSLFEQLLNYQDPDLYQILLRQKQVEDPSLHILVESILCGH